MAHGPVIGVLTPLVGGFYYGGLLTGIARSVSSAGGRVIAIQTLDAGHRNADFVQPPEFDSAVGWDHIAGFVAIVNAVPNSYLLRLSQTGKPLVIVSNDVPGVVCPVVMPDNRNGVAEAVRHLVAHGHTRIGFAGFLGENDIRERYDSYRQALVECDIEPDPRLFFAADNNDEIGGVAAAQRMLGGGLASTALVAGTDLNAAGISKTLQGAGYTLPRDQAIVGFDDAEIASHMNPMLSTVKQDFEQVGVFAADLVLGAVAGTPGQPGRHHVSASFIARESCGCPGWHTSGSDPQGSEKEYSRAQLEVLLRSAVRPNPDAATVAANAAGILFDLVGCALSGASLPPIGGLRQALGSLHRLDPTPESAHAIINAIRTFARSNERAERGAYGTPSRLLDDAVAGATWALAQAQGIESYERDSHLLQMLATQSDVSMDLLRGLDGDARNLLWLESTQVQAGVLATWSAGPGSALTIAGSFHRNGGPAADVGSALAVEAFPPRSMFTSNDAATMVFAVPVKTGASDWGWLATVGPVEAKARTGRETLTQWAALLTVALDEAAAAAALASLERERHAILEDSPDAIARYDTSLRYEYLNPAAAALLHMDGNDVIGRTDQQLHRQPAVAAVWDAGLRNVLASGAPTQVEFSIGGGVEKRWYQTRIVPQRGTDGAITGILTSTRDLTALKRAEQALAHQAVHDALTGLANRVLLLDRMTQSLSRLQRQPGRFAVMFIDLDHFKEINDGLGHEIGDRLLIQVAERLTSVSRRVDTVARFGGDEFVLLCDKIPRDQDVRAAGKRIVRSLAEPFFVDGRQLDLSASVGIVIASEPATQPAVLIREADAAMYQAKERGGNRFQIHSTSASDIHNVRAG
ncbi:MAG TPA: diguanylate cyclase [Acidothermaceae bacterium]|jgi:diguanylate cyclase (GGDEF)-like protein/PAS domain S-box-containing protein|nr:diguanylate cyclase [Acidothermaceae bacterium]